MGLFGQWTSRILDAFRDPTWRVEPTEFTKSQEVQIRAWVREEIQMALVKCMLDDLKTEVTVKQDIQVSECSKPS